MFVVVAEELSEEDGVSDYFEEPALNETCSKFSRFVGAALESMTANDSVGDDDEAGTMAKLTDVKIAAEVTREVALEEMSY